MGMRRPRPSAEIMSGDSADVYFARAEAILEREGLDPIVTMEVFTREAAVLCGIDEAKNLLGHVLATADPAETHLEALERRRHRRPEGDRPADPGPLSPVRPVRDGLPGDARPVDGLGHGGPRMRRGGGAGPGHQLRGAPHPPGHHRRAGLRRDRRWLRRRLHPGRRPPGRPRPDRHDAPFAGPDLRRHGRGGPGVRSAHRARGRRGSSWSTRSRTRPRKPSGWRTPLATGCTASASTRRRSAAG